MFSETPPNAVVFCYNRNDIRTMSEDPMEHAPSADKEKMYMKNILALMVCLAMMAGLASCGVSGDYGDDDLNYEDEELDEESETAGDTSEEGDPGEDGAVLDVSAAMQAVVDIVGAEASDNYFYDDGDMQVALLESGDLAVLVDDEGYDKVDCYCITMYDTERTDDNQYQPLARYYIPKTTGLVYLFDEDTGGLTLVSDAGT